MSVSILQGHAPDVLRSLPAKSVHCCVTSPPYWALRRYGTPPQVWRHPSPWGLSCQTAHDWGDELHQSVRGLNAGTMAQVHVTKKRLCPPVRQQGAFCQRCGAWRGELGSEPTPDLFLAHLVGVFAEVWRVLRDDGTLWVNLGDSYASGGMSNPSPSSTLAGGKERGAADYTIVRPIPPGLKNKDLCLIPWRFAIAMQDAGWYVRSIVAWTKPAPMPESVTDRPTSAWEPIFLFAKRPRYFYDAEAVRVAASEASIARISQPTFSEQHGGAKDYANGINANRSARKALEHFAENPGRNLWNYWPIGPEPSRLEHYAAYPTELVRRPIKAGTSERGCCATCGAPWRRVTERTKGDGEAYQRPKHLQSAKSTLSLSGGSKGWAARGSKVAAAGWEPTCAHGGDPVPCTVLDPFGGSGTTGMVADQLGRDAILIELKPEYAAMAAQRIRNDAPLFADVRTATNSGGESDGTVPDEAPRADGLTKQERHPNRTVRGFNQRWAAKQRDACSLAAEAGD